jgi:hypothetical protein
MIKNFPILLISQKGERTFPKRSRAECLNILKYAFFRAVTPISGVTLVCLFLCYTAGIEKQKTKTSILCRPAYTAGQQKPVQFNTVK